MSEGVKGECVVGVQVRGHAVEVLQRTQDEELLYYLLQLVQALRYEATTHSRLSAFLISRATRNTVMATLLHWQAPPPLCPSLPSPCSHPWPSLPLGETSLRPGPPGGVVVHIQPLTQATCFGICPDVPASSVLRCLSLMF